MEPKQISNRKELLELVQKGGIVAEVGSFRGDYAATIVSVAQPLELWLIDPWTGYNQITAEDGVTVYTEPNLAETFLRLHFRYDPRTVKLARGRGEELLDFFPDNYFDAIYVDAVHTTEAVKQDLDFANRKVRSGGFIFGHDWQYDSVKQGVYSFLAKTGYSLEYLTQEPLNSFGFYKGKKSYRSPVSLATIIATQGRGSLEGAIKSVLPEVNWDDGDEVWVISDGDNEVVRGVCARYPEVKYAFVPKSGGYGGKQRTAGHKLSSCRYSRYIDDDDTTVSGSCEVIKAALREDVKNKRAAMHIFRISNPDIWRERELRLGNVSTQCLVVPRVPGLPAWGLEYAADFHFADTCSNFLPVEWHEDVIAFRNSLR